MARSTTIVLQHSIAEELPWEAFAHHVDARERVLWIEGQARAALLHLQPGASIESHKHRRAAHHVWVVSGGCMFDGHHLRAGSYAHVPAGVEHGARAGIEGCTLFYLILPDEAAEGGKTDGCS
ncbi:MAG: cupin domain-containing protein [Actinomycetota bacterium]